AGGKYDAQKGEMNANVLSLGNFTVAVDLVAPVITPTIQNGAVVKGNSVVFRIKDNLSGIKDYRVEIDGHWVLAEHDAKTRRVIVPLQYAKITKGKKHSLVFVLEDNCGNSTTLKRTFTW
ncbi:MAG: M23 family peptidase, partial [Bacteroidales bacterium]|nr:M23 family peptidase [Bacteroidales bacterium]